MEKEKKKCSGTYLEDSHPDIYPESVKEESGYYVATKKKQGECIPMFAPVDVQLDQDDKTMVQPDLMIVCDRKKLTRQGVFGAPDFIIEILSESTRKKDSYLKLMKYQKAGGREYWLVDPDKKKVIVYDLEKVEIPVIYGFTDQVPVRIFDGKCVVDFSLIYENIKFIYEQS